MQIELPEDGIAIPTGRYESEYTSLHNFIKVDNPPFGEILLGDPIEPGGTPELCLNQLGEDVSGTVKIHRSQYGDQEVRVTRRTDEGLAEKFKFPVVNENMRLVRYNCDSSAIPHYVNYALVKANWFCTEWGQQAVGREADYYMTASTVMTILARDSPRGVIASMPSDALLTLQKLALLLMTSDVASATQISKGQKSEIFSMVEQEIEVEEDTEGLKYIDDSLANEGLSVDLLPKTCLGYFLNDFSTVDEMYQDLNTDRSMIEYDFGSISSQYPTAYSRVSDGGQEYIHVAVLTANSLHYDRFQVTSKGECACSTDGQSVPSIFCATLMQNEGWTITNLPTHHLADSEENPTMENFVNYLYDFLEQTEIPSDSPVSSNIFSESLLETQAAILTPVIHQQIMEDGVDKGRQYEQNLLERTGCDSLVGLHNRIAGESLHTHIMTSTYMVEDIGNIDNGLIKKMEAVGLGPNPEKESPVL